MKTHVLLANGKKACVVSDNCGVSFIVYDENKNYFFCHYLPKDRYRKEEKYIIKKCKKDGNVSNAKVSKRDSEYYLGILHSLVTAIEIQNQGGF